MTDADPTPTPPAWQTSVGVTQWSMPQDEPPPRSATDDTLVDLRVAAVLVVALAVLGAALGPLWSAWSGSQQRAYVIGPGQLYPYDEVETMAAADGRYLLIVAVVGLGAAMFGWWARAASRGPLVLLALGVGGLAGAALTWSIGYLTGGGTYDGKAGTTISHLPVTLHMHGLVFVEPAIATLLYGLFVAFAARDDLNRADPVRERVSVGAGHHPQHGWGDGDRAGPLQQRDLPPQ
jgi:hypothetical protein